MTLLGFTLLVKTRRLPRMRVIRSIPYIFLFAWMISLETSSSDLFAQDDPSNKPAQEAEVAAALQKMHQYRIEKSIEKSLRDLMTRYLSPDQYDIRVAVEALSAPQVLPYVPSSVLPVEDDLSWSLSRSKSIVVYLRLSKNIPLSRAQAIQKILEERIKYGTAKASIEFESLDIEADPKDDPTTRSIDDLKRRFDDLLRDQKENENAKALPTPSVEPAGKVSDPSEAEKMDWIPIIVGVIGLVTFCLTILLGLKLFSSSVSSIGTGIKSVASSLEVAASNIMAAFDNKDKDQETAKSLEDPEALPIPEVSQPSRTAPMPTADIKERVAALSGELEAGINDHNRIQVVSFLSELADKKITLPKAVALLELLPPATSRMLFEQLSREAQQSISTFFETGEYSAPKHEVMAVVGEETKTRLLGAEFKNTRGKLNLQLAATLRKASLEDLEDAIGGLDAKECARILLYLRPRQISKLMDDIKLKDDKKVAVLLEALTLIGKVADQDDMDSEINAKIIDKIGRSDGMTRSEEMKYLAEILAHTEDSVLEDALIFFQERDAEVLRHVRSSVVVFDDIFIASVDNVEFIISKCSNQDIALISSALEPEKKSKFMAMIDQRRQGPVQEELEVITAMSSFKRNKLINQSRQLVTKWLKDLQKRGELELEVVQQTTANQGKAA